LLLGCLKLWGVYTVEEIPHLLFFMDRLIVVAQFKITIVVPCDEGFKCEPFSFSLIVNML
jgi:hypothetical protein